MTRIATLLLAAGVLALVSPGAASARNFSINGGGGITYDSNQLRLPGGTATPAGRSKDDIHYSPSIGASYTRAGGRQTLSVNGLIGRDYYQNNTFLNRNRYQVGGTASYRAGGRCEAVANGSYTSRQNGANTFDTSAIDPTDPDDIGRLISNRTEVTAYGLSANCGGTSATGLSFGGGYSHSSRGNEDITRRFTDSDSDSFNAFAGIGILRPGQLQVTGSYSTISYPNRGAAIPGVPLPIGFSSKVKTYRVGLNFSRPIGSRLSGSVGVSYLRSRPDGPTGGTSSPAYNVALSYTASPRLGFSVSGSRDSLSSSTAAALYRVVDSINVNANYRLGAAINTRASFGYTRNNFQQSFATPAEPLARFKDTAKIVQVGVSYAPRKLYNVGLTASQTFRSSNPSLYDYNSTRVALTLGVNI